MRCPVRFRNLSPEPQTRVACVMLPTSVATMLPLGKCGVTSAGWIYQRGAEVGDQTRLWVRAEMGSLELRAIDLAPIVPATDVAWMVPANRFDWLLDKPGDAVLRAAVNGREMVFGFDRVVEQGPMVSLLRFTCAREGWWGVAYATVAAGQDVVDVCGMVVWQDGRVQPVVLHDVQLELRHGERHAGFLVASMGQQQPLAGRTPHVLHDGPGNNDWLSDAMAYGFFFTLVAESDAPPADLHLPERLREDNANAAFGGPILALADAEVWHGRIGPHRAALPDWFYTDTTRTFDPQLQRDPWAARPNANQKASGTTGDQGIWNRCPMLHLFNNGDPGDLVELTYSATDYFLRSHHFLDPTTFHPRTFESGLTDPCTTYNTAPFWRMSGGAWGKNGGNNDPPWGWDHGQRAYLDAQHRGNKTPAACLMLTGLPVFQDELDFLLAADIRDTRLRTQTLEAPRAAGRLLQEWAWWWCGATPTQRTRLEYLAQRMLAICEAQPSYNVPGPMKWLAVFSRAESKNPLRNTTHADKGYEAAAPWEHSFVCDGASAWAAIFQRLGNTALMSRFLLVAVNCAQAVVDGGLIEQDGTVHVVTYVKVNPEGAANPADYYALPRPPVQQADGSWTGAKTDLSANCDMVFGGISLFWFSGAILVAAKAGNHKAQRVREVLKQRATTQRDVEWLVGGL